MVLIRHFTRARSEEDLERFLLARAKSSQRANFTVDLNSNKATKKTESLSFFLLIVLRHTEPFDCSPFQTPFTPVSSFLQQYQVSRPAPCRRTSIWPLEVSPSRLYFSKYTAIHSCHVPCSFLENPRAVVTLFRAPQTISQITPTSSALQQLKE